MDRYKSFDSYELALRLQKVREAMGKSQQEVADDLGINRNQIKVWECGTREIKAKDLFTLSRYYGVSVDYLLGLTECASNDTNLRAVCDYTGLSEKAVEQLRFNREIEMGNVELQREYMLMPIRQAIEKYGVTFEIAPISFLIENEAEFGILRKISDFIYVNPDWDKKILIDDKANASIVDSANGHVDAYAKLQKTNDNSKFILQSSIPALLARALLDDIEKGLRTARKIWLDANKE